MKIVFDTWNEEIERDLEKCIKEGDLCHVSDYKAAIDDNKAILLGVYDGEKRICSQVLRFDENDHGCELVAWATAGHLKGGSIIEEFTPFLIDVAKRNNCCAIRAHTSKKGITKLYERAGWSFSEYVYKIEV